MQATLWIGMASPALVLAGAVIAAIAKLTRMTVVLEELGKDIRTVTDRVDIHDARLIVLERNARGRHRYR